MYNKRNEYICDFQKTASFCRIIQYRKKPTKIWPRLNCKAKTPLNQLECDSAIGLHLLQILTALPTTINQQFSILAKARTQFH